MGENKKWHNLAITVQKELNLSTLLVYYEDYESKFNETVQKIFDFLDLSMLVDQLPLFFKGKHYLNYFTNEEKKVAMTIIEEVADDYTWQLVKHYAPSSLSPKNMDSTYHREDPISRYLL